MHVSLKFQILLDDPKLQRVHSSDFTHVAHIIKNNLATSSLFPMTVQPVSINTKISGLKFSMFT